jgi:hypothetical protein
MTNYKAIVTFNNGTHRIIRMTRDLVAKFVTIFREMQRTPYKDLYAWNISGDEYMLMNGIRSVKFIDEYRGSELLTLS